MRRDHLGPRNQEAERAVLGACFASVSAATLVFSSLREGDFFFEGHREAFKALSMAGENHKELDYVVVQPYASEDVAGFLKGLYDAVPTAANTASYISMVKEAARARATLDAAERIREICLSEDFADAPQNAYSLVEEIAREENDRGAQTLGAYVDEFMGLVRERRKRKGVTGIRTGISKMDNALGGLNRGCSYIIAARPGMGKSLVCGQIARTAAEQDYKVLLQTPEMGAVQYLDRLAHTMAYVDYEEAQQGRITDSQEQAIEAAAKLLAKVPLVVDDSGTQLASRVRANVMRHKPDLLIVDYLQYMAPDDPGASRNQQVGQISRHLNRIKGDFGIPVVIAAQLSRALEGRSDKRPMLSDLRDSGEIEQDADAVMFLHRPSRYDDRAPEDLLEIHCEKWRFGSLWETSVYLKPGANWLLNDRHGVA